MTPPSDVADVLAPVLDRQGVVAAYLFGSHARGTADESSDVDVAVWLDPELGAAEQLDRELALLAELEGRLGDDGVDLVVLNAAPPLLRHRVLRDGVVLVDRDPLRHMRLRTDALIEFLDTEPLRVAVAEGQRRRLAEDRFGRP
jgi:predicted nucleotidyltransferase